jgi:hypothetical protein
MVPQVFSATLSADDTADYKEKIRESIQKTQNHRFDRFLPVHLNSPTFCVTTTGSRQVGKCRRKCAAGKHELSQRRHLIIKEIHPVFQPRTVIIFDAGSTRNTEIASEVEQQLLDFF